MEVLIAHCKESALQGMEVFFKTFSFVPDDRLTWTPAPNTKSAIQIAAHTAVTAGNFAMMLRDRRIPSSEELPEFLSRTIAAELALTSRSEVEAVLKSNTDEVLAALDTLTPDAIGMRLSSDVGVSFPMTFLMNLPGMHAMTHAGQIDYLQTCWGDQEVHF